MINSHPAKDHIERICGSCGLVYEQIPKKDTHEEPDYEMEGDCKKCAAEQE